MDIRVLEYFLMVAREENITKAAQLLHMTQPTMSRQLMQLEEELGVKLFVRSNHNVILTNEGILFRCRAQDIVSLSEKAKGELKQTEELAGQIAIGCGELQSMEELSGIMTAFQAQHPMVMFQLRSGHNEDIKRWIEQGIIDMGLLIEPVDISKYEFIRMKRKEEWGILVHQDSPFASYPSIRPGDLTGIPLITVNDEAIHKELGSWSGKYAAEMCPVIHYNLLYNAAVMVKRQAGVAICLKLNCKYEDLCYVPFEPKIEFSSVLAWREKQPQAAAAQAFIHFARSCESQV